jgi:hypothetical protein
MAIVDGYVTLEDVKADLRLRTTTDDARLEVAIMAASRCIDNVTHTKWTSVTEARTYTSTDYKVFVDDCSTVTLVRESQDRTTWTTVATTAWTTNPRGLIRSIVRIDGGTWLPYVEITATWGRGTVVDTDIQQACRILSARYFKRADTPEGVLTGDFGAARLSRNDPDVYKLLKSKRRPVVG